jgi:hypothetical protein
MVDVYTMHATGATISLTELEEMPQEMVSRLILLRDVVNVATYGGELKL